MADDTCTLIALVGKMYWRVVTYFKTPQNLFVYKSKEMMVFTTVN